MKHRSGTLLITSLLSLFMLVPALTNAQDSTPTPYDLTTIDGVLEALYGSISGEKGEARDWDTFRQLFRDGAQLIPTSSSSDGKFSTRFITPEQYIEQSGPYLVENGFIEEEIHREVHRFDPIAQVFSTYTSRNSADGPIIARGINSIQLLHDGERWWVVNVYWAAEGEGRPIPVAYDNR